MPDRHGNVQRGIIIRAVKPEMASRFAWAQVIPAGNKPDVLFLEILMYFLFRFYRKPFQINLRAGIDHFRAKRKSIDAGC